MKLRFATRVIGLTTAAVLLLTSLIAAGLPVFAAKKKSGTRITPAAPAVPAATYPVALSAAISGSNVVICAEGMQATDDGLYHLYAQNVWESGTQGTEIAQQPAGNAQFTTALNNDRADSVLFKKFVVRGVVQGQLTQLSNAGYITNPEAVADHTHARLDSSDVKGLLPDSGMIENGMGSLSSAGVKKISYNLPISSFVGTGITYNYMGKSYHFNAGIVGAYKVLVSRCQAAGIQVNMILLCDPQIEAAAPDLVHPLSRGTGGNYYMFNAGDQGALHLEALAAFLGENFPGIDNWIVGNEVNARNPWNNGQWADAASFSKAYADTVRVFYNGIRSQNANAQIYVATDQEWLSDNPAIHFGAKEMLTDLNACIASEGNIAWGLSNHPYNVPLYAPSVAAMPANPKVTHDRNTSAYVTMENIEILTDFMCQQPMLSPDGSVRPILLSEVGFTSSAAAGSNEQYQAADIVYALNRAATNRYINGIIINRQRTHVAEVAQGLDYGLLNADGSQKLAYQWYVGAQDPAVIAQASSVLGIDILQDCAKYAR